VDKRTVFLGVVAAIISITAGSNLTQLALTSVSATKSTIISAAPTNSLTSMPGSLDSAKAFLADAIRDMRSGNNQHMLSEAEAANQTITQFQHPIQNVMNTENENSMMHLTEAIKDIKAGDIQSALVQLRKANQTITQFQQGMLNMMNAHNTYSPFMAAENISQQQSILGIMNSNKTQTPLIMAVGGNSTHHQEMRNMMSMLNNSNVNFTSDRSGSTTASHMSKK
jgi:hypothetical protein